MFRRRRTISSTCCVPRGLRAFPPFNERRKPYRAASGISDFWRNSDPDLYLEEVKEEEGMPMAKTFREQLIAARDEHHSKSHPFIDLWAHGKLTRPQMAVYVIQHYHFVSDYLNWMLYAAALTPHRDVKEFLLE